MAQRLAYRLLIEKVPSSVLSLSINGIVLKIQIKITGSPEYTGTDVLIKSVDFKVPTVRAYDVAEIYRWVPAQVSTSSLDRGSKLRGVIGCVKAPHGG